MKARNTFESLIDKHKNYDIEYTPRFLRIITEMIKNDAKSFKVIKNAFKFLIFFAKLFIIRFTTVCICIVFKTFS